MSYDEEFSDENEAFDEDMEALRNACLLTGANPSVSGVATSALSDVEDSDDDDIEMVRNLRKKFADYANLEGSLSLTPLWSVPLDSDIDNDDDNDVEDDFEALRAIRRRFGAYNDGGVKENTEDSIERTEQVGVTNKIALEKEASNSLFVKTNNNAEEGFPNCVDSNNIATQNLGTCSDPVTSELVGTCSDRVTSELVGTCSEHYSSELVEWQDSGARNVPTFPLKTSGLPKSALAFVDAIKKNRSCQKAIRSKLMQVQARMEEIKTLKDRVKILKDFQTSCKVKTGRALSQKKDPRVQLISQVKQRSSSKSNQKKIPAMSYRPPENSHVAIYKEVLTKFPSTVTRERWSKKEISNLKKGVKQQFQEKLLQQSVDMLNDTDELSIEGGNLDMIVASIRDCDITPQNMRSFLPKVNWEQLASMYVPTRSGLECQSRWLNCEDPLINWNPWTNMEEKNLLHIVQQKGPSNWIDIAVSLGTNRTPFQCLARYQRSLNASIIRREWTKEEDIKIQAAVEEYGESNWQVVASFLEGRTGTQCSNRWMKSLHPARKRVGKWTPDEDKRLKVAVMIFGPKNYSKIAEFVPGRMQSQCRERWTNSLDPSLILGGWTSEEDLLLEEAILKHGYCWSKVASCVPHRTDNQCMRRWAMLFPEQVPLLRAAKKTKRVAMISNFVDRESERPAIGPHDFLQLPAIDPPLRLKKPPSRPKKSFKRRRVKRTRKDNSSGDDTSEEEVLRLTNGTEGEDGQEAGTSVTQIRRSSRQRKRKVIIDDDDEDDDDSILTQDSAGRNKRQKLNSNNKRSLPIPSCENPDNLEPLDVSIADYDIEDDSMLVRDLAGKNKKQKLKLIKKNLPITSCEDPDNLEPLDVSVADYNIDDYSMVARDSAGRGKKQKLKSNKKKNLPIPICENPDNLESLDVCIADYNIDDDSMVARNSAGRNRKQKLKSNKKKNLPIPICENHDNPEFKDIGIAVTSKRRKSKRRSKPEDEACSAQNHESEEDGGMTLASFLGRSSRAKKSSHSAEPERVETVSAPERVETASVAEVSLPKGQERLGTIEETSSGQMQVEDTRDDLPLLRLDASSKAEESAIEETTSGQMQVEDSGDDLPLSRFCKNSKDASSKAKESAIVETSSGQMQLEDSGDDLPLSRFCKKSKDASSKAEESAIEMQVEDSGDDLPLSRFCKKLNHASSKAGESAIAETSSGQMQVEDSGDDLPLSRFCKNSKDASSKAKESAIVETSSGQMQLEDSGDDLPLSRFCKKSKDASSKAEESAIEMQVEDRGDDLPLSRFCKKLNHASSKAGESAIAETSSGQMQVEDSGDDLPLSRFCKNSKDASSKAKESAIVETSSGQMQLEDSGDDLPLSRFCKKSKDASSKAEESAIEMQVEDSGDDLPLSRFCKKLNHASSKAGESAIAETSSGQMQVEDSGDDLPLSRFCKKSKDTSSKAEESADDLTLSHFCTRLKTRRMINKLFRYY